MLKFFKAIDVESVDFGYVDRVGYIDGITIYRQCFERYRQARYSLERPEAEWSKLAVETEIVFFYLVEQGMKYGYDVDSILEIPDSTGETCFSTASACSKKISRYIIERDI